MLDDKLLIWRFNHGSREVLHEIYDRYKHDLLTLAAALLNEVGAAEDVVHDVFVSFLKTSGRFRLTGSLKGFLVTCVANAARSRNRARRRHSTAGLDQVEGVAADSGQPEPAAIWGEELARLSWAMKQLPYEQLEVLVLHIHGGLRFKAIARQQAISINTARGRYRYAITRLRSLLNGEVLR